MAGAVIKDLTLIVFPRFSGNKPIYRQRQIPNFHCKSVNQDHAANQSSENDVERNYANSTGDTKPYRDQREHLANAKRHSTSKPDQKSALIFSPLFAWKHYAIHTAPECRLTPAALPYDASSRYISCSSP